MGAFAVSDETETCACFCGAIGAVITGAPFWVVCDHDDDCRRALGGPLAVWVGVRPSQFRLTRGAPKSFSKTKGVVRTFCGDCGSPVTYADEGLPEELYVALGFLDHPERLRPQAHAYWSMRLPWVEFADDLPRVEGYSRPRDPAHGTPKDRARD